MVFIRTISASPTSAVKAEEGLHNDVRDLSYLLLYTTIFHHLVMKWRLSPCARRMSKVIHHRRLFIGNRGFIGLGPEAVKKGDVVAVLFRGPFPYILRPVSDSQLTYELAGEYYVDGTMHGKALHHVRENAEAPGVQATTSKSRTMFFITGNGQSRLIKNVI